MIYEDGGSERKRKEKKHLQRLIQTRFTAASYVEFEFVFCFFFLFTFSHLLSADFISLYFYPLFRGGWRVPPPFITPSPPPL